MKAMLIRYSCDGPGCEATADVPEPAFPAQPVKMPDGWQELRDPRPSGLVHYAAEQGPIFHSKGCWTRYANGVAEELWPARPSYAERADNAAREGWPEPSPDPAETGAMDTAEPDEDGWPAGLRGGSGRGYCTHPDCYAIPEHDGDHRDLWGHVINPEEPPARDTPF